MNPSTLPAPIALLCALAGGAPAAAVEHDLKVERRGDALTVWENDPSTAPEKP